MSNRFLVSNSLPPFSFFRTADRYVCNIVCADHNSQLRLSTDLAANTHKPTVDDGIRLVFCFCSDLIGVSTILLSQYGNGQADTRGAWDVTARRRTINIEEKSMACSLLSIVLWRIRFKAGRDTNLFTVFRNNMNEGCCEIPHTATCFGHVLIPLCRVY
jgi:hypothetical protein